MSEPHPLVSSVQPIADVLDAEIIATDAMLEGDIPLVWNGDTVAALRLPTMRNALDRLVAVVERELGAPLGELERVDKQRAVRMLEEQGAFQLRKSIEEIADVMGVSRITIYNYLNTVKAGGPQ